MARSTIWVVNEAGHPTWIANDLIPDADIKPLTIGSTVNPLRVDRLSYHLAEGIGRYAKEEDYLLISGSPMINAMAVLLWILRFGAARILQWKASERRYELSEIREDDLRTLLGKMMVPAV